MQTRKEVSMTISIAWIKRTKKAEQLLFVSDSRISGGETFDCCPKILCLSNRHAIAFAGNSDRAFPLMLQLSLALESHRPSALGQLSVAQVKQHALVMFDEMAAQISGSNLHPPQEVLPGVSFLFGGYSWDTKRFQLWSIEYNAGKKAFAAIPARWLSFKGNRLYASSSKSPINSNVGSLIMFGGDQALDAQEQLFRIIAAKYPEPQKFTSLSMEPLIVVRDMLRQAAPGASIGGALQLVNIRQNLQAECFGVYWPNKEAQTIHLQGRRLTKYERIDNPVIDPDSLEIEYPWLTKSADEPVE